MNEVLESLTHPFYVINAENYEIEIANKATKCDSREITHCYKLTHNKDAPCKGENNPCPLEAVKKTKEPAVFEHIHYDENGSMKNVEAHGFPIFDYNGNVIRMIEYTLDITERKNAEKLQKLAVQVMELINRSGRKIDIIQQIIILIKVFTGVEAVGIRLKEDYDYPYYETYGFPVEFVSSEKYLCAYNEEGEPIRDLEGNIILECMCGNIICGRIDPSLPFFTENGAFWTNCTTELPASTIEEDRQSRIRNHCNEEGYESVALIPLQSDEEIIGLLQLNDTRKGMFTLQIINFLTGLGASIGICLARMNAEEQIEASLIEKEILLKEIHHRVKNNMQIISSLLSLQVNDIDDPKTKEKIGREPGAYIFYVSYT